MTPPTDDQLANRRAWLVALRSGNYRQARRVLRRNDGFCCLGVAEDVVDCEWVTPGSDPAGLVVGAVATHVATHPDRPELNVEPGWTSLTRTAEERLGLPRVPWVTVRSPRTPYHWVAASLVSLNDDLRFAFSRIASVIEDQGETWDGTHIQATALADHRNARRSPPLVTAFRS